MIVNGLYTIIRLSRSKKIGTSPRFTIWGLCGSCHQTSEHQMGIWQLSSVPFHLTATILIFANPLLEDQHQNGCLILIFQ